MSRRALAEIKGRVNTPSRRAGVERGVNNSSSEWRSRLLSVTRGWLPRRGFQRVGILWRPRVAERQNSVPVAMIRRIS